MKKLLIVFLVLTFILSMSLPALATADSTASGEIAEAEDEAVAEEVSGAQLAIAIIILVVGTVALIYGIFFGSKKSKANGSVDPAPGGIAGPGAVPMPKPEDQPMPGGIAGPGAVPMPKPGVPKDDESDNRK
ncbi:MAG: hypothetical protein LUC89_05610 [Oscillospiraceae bacterium]|nr:hypothetical protein [Oscillospiraceae bacterium]